MIVEDQKIHLTISENLLKNLQGMFYKLTSPPDLTMIYASEGCCNLTGYTLQELLENNYINILHPEDQASFKSVYFSPETLENINILEYRIICKDGSTKWVRDIANSNYSNKDNILDIEGFVIDITRQKRDNTRVNDLKKEHKGLINELTQRYNELMQFNYIVSHNLRSPIANIIGLTEILKFHYAEEASDTGELVTFISGSANSIDAIIQDLNLILSSSNPINEKREDLILRDVLRSVKSSLKKQIKDANAVVEISVSEELYSFKSIKSYIQSILYNLISNAIKYSRDGVIPVINIRGTRNGEKILIEVSDNGIGIDLAAVGDKLFGLYKKFNFDKEGRGLGLHMTKTQVQSLGGTIEVSSEPGQGTTFKVILPA